MEESPQLDAAPTPRRNKKNLDLSVDIFATTEDAPFLDKYGGLTMTDFNKLTNNEKYWVTVRVNKLVANEMMMDFRVWNLYGVVNGWVRMADGIGDAVKRGIFDNITLDTNPLINKFLPWAHLGELRERRAKASGYTSSSDLEARLQLMKIAYAFFVPQMFNNMRRSSHDAFLKYGGTNEEFAVVTGDDYTKAVDSALRPIMKLLRRIQGIKIPRGDNPGFDIEILQKPYEEKKKMVGPWCKDANYWVFIANNYSRSKIAPHILVLYDCDAFGYITKVWGAAVDLECRADGKGDVKFVPQTEKKTEEDVNNARASIPVTWEMASRPTFHQFCGQVEAFKKKRSEKFRQVPYLVTEDISNYKNLQKPELPATV